MKTETTWAMTAFKCDDNDDDGDRNDVRNDDDRIYDENDGKTKTPITVTKQETETLQEKRRNQTKR